jgi:formiminoglutamase
MRDPADVRVGDLVRRDSTAREAGAVIIGFPSDEGVRRNGGRVGAAAGPQATRQELYAMTPGPGGALSDLLERTIDLGDVAVSGDVEVDQERLAEALAPWIERRTVAVVVGGGHETSYGHFLGYVRAARDAAILNWDAHPDVRPLVDGLGHSGSPFRQAIAHPSGRCRRYVVAGLLPHRVAAAHARFVTDHRGECVWREAVTADLARTRAAALGDSVLVSFDLDAVDAAHAPGVSAPATGGLTPDLWLAAAFAAGRHPGTASMDVVELNPRFDADGRTARLAAVTVWTFLAGVAERVQTS